MARLSASILTSEKLQIARMEAQQQGIGNVEFRVSDIREALGTPTFDVVYSRCLLTHLSDPAGAVSAFYRHLRPGGQVAVEDIDFSGHFTYPESPAFLRYRALYSASVVRRGGDPNIGPRLPALLRRCGFEDIGVAVVQHVAMQGEAKLTSPLTMENIADTILAEGLAGQEEIEELVRELYEFAADPATLAGTPRIVQAWGRRGELATNRGNIQE
jgi:SAM-dependent methyltransferase